MNSKIIPAMAVCILILVAILAFGELIVRLINLSGDDCLQFVSDKELGWCMKNNFHWSGYKRDAANGQNRVTIQTNEYGFRMFGDLNQKKKRILVLGDSFTHAVDVDTSKTWYGVLKDKLNVEIFAYGASGYSTLQEYMILKKYMDIIKPDLILWQLCSNDIIDNSYALGFHSKYNNLGLMRPYLQNHKVVYRLPKRLPWLRDFINKYSRLLYMVSVGMEKLRSRIAWSDSTEDKIWREGIDNNRHYHEAVAVTVEIMRDAKRLHAIPIVAFCVDSSRPYTESLKQICMQEGISFIAGVAEKIEEQEGKGVIVKAYDHSHWNETGHQICAERIVAYLKDNNLL